MDNSAKRAVAAATLYSAASSVPMQMRDEKQGRSPLGGRVTWFHKSELCLYRLPGSRDGPAAGSPLPVRMLPHTSSSSSANASPPKQTSVRHDIEGMNLCSFALHFSFAASSLVGSQLLMSGRLAAATPVVPRRCLTIGRVSSAGLPLKFPQCPSWPG